jgi:hypothetical protein
MLKSSINQNLAWPILMILVIGMFCLTKIEYSRTLKEINKSIQEKTFAFEEKALYLIDKGNGKVKSYRLILKEDSTVFSLLKELAERENFKIEFTIHSDGVSVDAIDGLLNGTENKYWRFWLNGELIQFPADKVRVKEGDKVEWKFVPIF